MLCSSAHAGKEEGMERAEMCCFSYPGLVKVAPFLCVDELRKCAGPSLGDGTLKQSLKPSVGFQG